MPRLTHVTTTSCFALILGAPMALADLSATDVWSGWKDYMDGFGYAMSGLERETGNGIEISNMAMSMTMPDGTFSMELGQVNFVEQGDGSVRIELPDVLPTKFDVDPTAGEAVSGTINFTQSDHSLVATGSPESTTYTYTAGSAGISMDGMTVEGVTVGSDAFGITMAANDLQSVSTMTDGDLRSFVQEMSSGGLSYAFNFKDPTKNDSFSMKADIEGFGFEGKGSLPNEMDPADANAMLAAGFAFDGIYTFGSGASEVTFDGVDGSGTINSTGGGGILGVDISQQGLSYKVTQDGFNVNMLFSAMPVPVSFASERAAFDLTIPTVKMPDAQDFGMLLSLENLTMADVLWGMFDPTAQLPRDPATLTVDLSGKAKLLFDYLDPTQAALLETTGAAPGELEAMTLNQLILDVAGARLTGAGAFSFDNTDTVTFDGLPKPTGAVDFELVGGNGLLDKLVAMGLLPEDQAMGARMMMGLFARPGEGEDSLTSKIEVNEAGHILANGQRIQ